MKRFALKGCPRCGGDLALDLYDELSCLQCGYAPRPTPLPLLLGRERQPVGVAS